MILLLIFLPMKLNTTLRYFSNTNLVHWFLHFSYRGYIVKPFIWCLQPLWRFTEDTRDSRLLVYRSEDIRNVSRLAAPKVCGYISADASEVLPESVRVSRALDEDDQEENGKSLS